MRISDYCRLLIKKYPHDESVINLINLLKEMRPAEGVLRSISIDDNDAEWFRRSQSGSTTYGGLVYVTSSHFQYMDFEIILKVKPNNYSMTELVCTLAHEAGHFLSLTSRSTLKERITYASRLNQASQFLFTGMLLYSEWELLMAEEMIAWAHARKLLKAINFKDWGFFQDFRRDCLRSYEWHLQGAR